MGTQTLNYEPAYDHHDDDQHNDEKYENTVTTLMMTRTTMTITLTTMTTKTFLQTTSTMKWPRGRDHVKRTSSQNLQCDDKSLIKKRFQIK